MAARVSWSCLNTFLPLHFRLASDGSASDFFRHFSCERGGRAVWFGEEFLNPSWPISWRHHRGRGRSSSTPCRCGSPCLMFFSIVRRRGGWLFWIRGRIPVLADVEVAVGQPETVLDLNVDVPFDLQKGNRSDPVSHFDVILESGHLFHLYFVIGSVLGRRALYFGLGDRGSWAIHFKNIKFKSNITTHPPLQ